MGVFLVDSFCLGVKDAFLSEIMEVDWADQLARMIPEDERLAIHPACARKYIEGAVAYAESLGFLLHRDFKKARRAFGSVAASDCSEAFTYGKDGKPFLRRRPERR